MGWADCGTDDLGRPIGYAFEAECDHPECQEEIDRGLAYCCGGMHGNEPMFNAEGEFINACGRYFCEKHRTFVVAYEADGTLDGFEVCEACRKAFVNEFGEIEDPGEAMEVKGPTCQEHPDEESVWVVERQRWECVPCDGRPLATSPNPER